MLPPELLSALRPASGRVIGIGEHAHGDSVSWRWRLAIAAELVRQGRRLILLCENADCYVSGLRKRRPAFARDETPPPLLPFHPFLPFLMPMANRSQEHLEAARELARLAEGRVYGVEVQAVDYPALLRCGGRYVRSLFARVDAAARWAADANNSNGRLRNILNAEVVAQVHRDHPGHTVLYLAHNEHVALSCETSREDPGFRTDGSVLRRLLGRRRYLSIATYSPRMWSFWNVRRHLRSPKLITDETRGHPAASGIIVGVAEGGAAPKPKPMGSDASGAHYTTADFDLTICEAGDATRHRRRPVAAQLP